MSMKFGYDFQSTNFRLYSGLKNVHLNSLMTGLRTGLIIIVLCTIDIKDFVYQRAEGEFSEGERSPKFSSAQLSVIDPKLNSVLSLSAV